MRNPVFKISYESLKMKDWDEWKRIDQSHFTELATKNQIQMRLERDKDEMVFYGEHENLFYFLHDLAYRYDIEIV